MEHRHRTQLWLLVATLTLLPTSQAGAVESHAIPTELVQRTDQDSRPTPICSLCKVRTVTSSDSSPYATLWFTFDDTDDGGYMGKVSTYVRLSDGLHVEVLANDDVQFSNGMTISFILDSGDGWSWHDVEAVYLVLSPRS